MNDKRKTYALVAPTLLFFTAAYFYIPPGPPRQVLIYYLIILGLACSSTLNEIVVVTNGLGLLLLLVGMHQWFVPTFGLAVLLVATPLLPAYYAGIARREKEAFRDRIFSMQDEAQKLQDHLAELTLQRHNLENEIDRINQLYILGRELVEHLEIDEVVANIQRILSHNPGIREVCVFSWDKDGWIPLHIPPQRDPAQWVSFVRGQKYLRNLKVFQVLETPAWLGDDTVVFLPVFLEKNLLAAIFLVTEKGYGQQYVERASIFIPQIALGLKRTRLFLEVQERSRNDGLTGLYLRRYFLERLQTEIQRARRYSTVFSLLLADLDHFKAINDTHGHLIGDKVLREAARVFARSVRPGDMIGRYGGEEFIVLLPLSGPAEALECAERIREALAANRIDIGGQNFAVTVSIGVCHYPQDGDTLKELLAAADNALYWVKSNGRNGIKEYGEVKKESRKRRVRPDEGDEAPALPEV